MMHEQNIDTLCDEAKRLLSLKIKFLDQIQSEPGVITESRDGENQTLDKGKILKRIEELRGEQTKLETLDMVLAVVGTMKAGKSTTINAIVGTEVLPNRNRPMTTLPTLIRHTRGQTVPALKFTNCQPINNLIEVLAKKIKTPEGIKALSAMSSTSDMDELLGLIATQGKFPDHFEGSEAIFTFLKGLNDLVRLCSALDVDFPFDEYDEIHEMPVIEVEFAHLRETKITKGRLTLLDTPGPNEAGQHHLRKMLTEQLRKASAVLAVLDFTQLKSDADAQVRKELEDIASVVQGRIYTLVNKFDQKDRHGDNEAQVKTFVAESLLPGIVKESEVFPVSSKWGYLANRAKNEMFLNRKLPDHNEHPWVADFAEEALGRRWQEKLSDHDDLISSAQDLWDDSLFSTPLEMVIRSAHARAAAFAIDSAAAKLVDISSEINTSLSTRETALSKSAKDLQKQINELQKDIESIENSEKNTIKAANSLLSEVTRSSVELFKRIEQDSISVLDGYFKEGKLLQLEQIEKKNLGREQGPKGKGGSGFFTFFSNSSKDEKIQDFDPEDPVIQLDSHEKADELSGKIRKSIEQILKGADKAVQKEIGDLVKQFRQNFKDEISVSSNEIIRRIEDRMNGEGFTVDISIPIVKLVSLDFSAQDVLEGLVNKQNKTRTGSRRQSGLWGGICSIFGTSDWGWESYEYDVEVFEIDIRKVNKSVRSGIHKAFTLLDKSISEHIQDPLRHDIALFFEEFRTKVAQIRGDLLQSIRDQEQGREAIAELAIRLSRLKKSVPNVLEDSRELKREAQPLLLERAGEVV